MLGDLQGRQLGPAAFGLFVALIGVVVGVETLGMSVGPAYSRIGPRIFPFIMAGGLVLFGLLLIAEGLRLPAQGSRRRVDWPALGLISLGLLLQMALLRPIGYVVATTLLFLFAAIAFGDRRWVLTIPLGLALAGATYAAFTWGLDLNLPSGRLWAGAL